MKIRKKAYLIILISLLIFISGSFFILKHKSLKGNTQVVGNKKILYYRNPMNPTVTSPVPMKDSMGMDYIPVYEEEQGTQVSGVYISEAKEQLIGVKKENVAKRHLVKDILTVGKVSFNPELYIAQQEYLQALKSKESGEDISRPLIEAATMKLLLLGMNKGEIQSLAESGKPDKTLYLLLESDIAWVYLTIFEYEMDFIKEGLFVEIEAVAFPGDKFEGEVTAITPVLDAISRSLQVRVKVKDPGHKLKPQMFVNAKIKADLGDKLAIPDTAVIDTGVRKIVYVEDSKGYLHEREVRLGHKADGFYEVVDGLKEGDMVVTSGNFLVDSESKLKGAISSDPEDQPGGNGLASDSQSHKQGQ